MSARAIKILVSLGMVSVLVYAAHLIVGHLLWPEYNMVTTDISSLTADSAPTASVLRVFTTIYGLCFVGFSVGMVLVAWRMHMGLVRAGYVSMLVLALATSIGYGLFPLAADKTTLGLQNMMHLLTTGVVVVSALASLYLLAVGYLRQEKMRRLGTYMLIAAIMMTLAGPLNPIVMALDIDIVGITERLVVYTLHGAIAVLSYWYLRMDITLDTANV